jgi:predicted DNA-binding antitoxin AbrB/MazE fold protein
MTRQLEAVFSAGVLRPLEPLSLAENQHVFVMISEIPTGVVSPSRSEELEWLRLHEIGYRGQWVALQGSELISHGSKARTEREEARRKGYPRTLMVRISQEPSLPSAGWL